MKPLVQGVVGEQTTPQRFADSGEELDGFECLETADDATQRPEDTGFTATRHAAAFGWHGEETAITWSAVRGVEDRHLTLEFIDTAVNQRPAREKSRIIV